MTNLMVDNHRTRLEVLEVCDDTGRQADDVADSFGGQIVLLAFADVERSLTAYAKEQIRRQSLTESIQASQKALTLANDLHGYPTVGEQWMNVEGGRQRCGRVAATRSTY